MAAERKLPKQAARWPPPAWQCYASDDMADERYKLASLGEIGLLTAMRNYAWVNGSVPRDKGTLARLLSLNLAEVERHHGTLIEANFRPDPNDETRLFSPDLERQRQRLAHIRKKQSRAGANTSRKRREAAASKGESPERSALRSAQRSAGRSVHAPELNRTELKRGLPEHDDNNRKWLEQYDSTPAPAGGPS